MYSANHDRFPERATNNDEIAIWAVSVSAFHDSADTLLTYPHPVRWSLRTRL